MLILFGVTDELLGEVFLLVALILTFCYPILPAGLFIYNGWLLN